MSTEPTPAEHRCAQCDNGGAGSLESLHSGASRAVEDAHTDTTPAQASTETWCERFPDEGHSWKYTSHAGTPRIETRTCITCGYLSVAPVHELIERLRSALAAAYAENARLRSRVAELTDETKQLAAMHRTVANELAAAHRHIGDLELGREVLRSRLPAAPPVLAPVREACTVHAPGICDGKQLVCTVAAPVQVDALAEKVAQVIEDHELVLHASRGEVMHECMCGQWRRPTDDDEAQELHAAHRAKAVIAAVRASRTADDEHRQWAKLAERLRTLGLPDLADDPGEVSIRVCRWVETLRDQGLEQSLVIQQYSRDLAEARREVERLHAKIDHIAGLNETAAAELDSVPHRDAANLARVHRTNARGLRALLANPEPDTEEA